MWPAPEPGDIVWCRFPEKSRDKPGPKPRPGLILNVTKRSDGIEVVVAYGTSQGLGRLRAGEFAIRKREQAAAYALARLSYDTKFDLAKTLLLPWDGAFFDVPPNSNHGQVPKLGTLHSGMMKVVEAALRATRSTP
ncbi:MAG: hypothetical protein IT518_09290 [Burkholderiales bacterium]|nr:hypothetical protein [Burkholderiales bacterium]